MVIDGFSKNVSVPQTFFPIVHIDEIRNTVSQVSGKKWNRFLEKPFHLLFLSKVLSVMDDDDRTLIGKS